MKKKILVIDDDPAASQLIAELLQAQGHEAVASFNFEDALRRAQQGAPDLVVVDAVMPEISGFEACRKLKKMFETRPPLVIMMTAKFSAFDPILAREMGADDFVVKTGDMSFVVKAVRDIFPKEGLSS
ncbi:MAG TPA: response regulator transcription factor [Candidatus Omnitrophota bacterium]|nr:response regulator transcription factor [Candidatus Omnitrophota bacterium]HRY86043.1 response regulator transcription factor [Candidatus Omnitrophota bacterium]